MTRLLDHTAIVVPHYLAGGEAESWIALELLDQQLQPVR